MSFVQCLWENLQILLEMQNTLHPLQISLQQSYMGLATSCTLLLCIFFFNSGPNSTQKVERRTIPWSGNLESSQRWELGTGQAQPHTFICQWRILPLEQYTWKLLPVFAVSKAAVFVCICMQTPCVSNMSVRLGFSHDCDGLKVLVCLSQIE